MHACVIIGSSAIDYESDRWTDLVDRGGLTHISQPFHILFVAIDKFRLTAKEFNNYFLQISRTHVTSGGEILDHAHRFAIETNTK